LEEPVKKQQRVVSREPEALRAVRGQSGGVAAKKADTVVIDQGFMEAFDALSGDVNGIKTGMQDVKRVRVALEKMEAHMGTLVELLQAKWAPKEVTGTGSQTQAEEVEEVEMGDGETESQAPETAFPLSVPAS
jgi:hypothetical protein